MVPPEMTVTWTYEVEAADLMVRREVELEGTRDPSAATATHASDEAWYFLQPGRAPPVTAGRTFKFLHTFLLRSKKAGVASRAEDPSGSMYLPPTTRRPLTLVFDPGVIGWSIGVRVCPTLLPGPPLDLEISGERSSHVLEGKS